MGVRIPQIPDIENAIRIYYENIELANKQIRDLFGITGSAQICGLKKMAHQLMVEKGVPSFNAMHVNTRVAYEAWGLDIDDLEARYNKLIKLKLIKREE